jgi:AraC-like DNA-binding protein
MSIFIHGHTWRAAESLEGLRIASATEHHTKPPRVSNNYNLPTWTLLYLYEGKCLHSRSSRESSYLQTPAQALLHPPNTDRYEYAADSKTSHAAYILFKDSKKSHLRKLCLLPRQWLVFQDDPARTLGTLVKECADIGFTTGEPEFWKAQAILCRIVDLLLTSGAIDDNRYQIAVSGNFEHSTQVSLSSQVDAYFHANIDRVITLQAIAEDLGVSVSTLTHQYIKETGIAPMTAFAQKKIDRIKTLLQFGYTVKAVARQTGFPDSSGLCKFFKRNSGLTPSKFLNRRTLLKSSE